MRRFQGVSTRRPVHGLAAACLLGLSVPVLAEGLPDRGEYRVVYTGLNPAPAKPLTIGPQRSVTTGIALMTAVNVAGSGFLHNMTGRCTVAPILDGGAKTVENQGYCEYLDADGDRVVERWQVPVQAVGATVQGTGEWIDGTGKFAGIGGQFAFRARRLPAASEGVAQFVGEKVGSYAITRKTASGD